MAKEAHSDQLTPLELMVMKILWETGPAPVSEVHQRIQSNRTLAYNTVQTVLSILHRKGKVKRETRDRAYIYSPAVSQERAAGQALKDMVDRLFGGRPEELVLSMIRSRQLSVEKLAELQQMVEDAEGGGHG